MNQTCATVVGYSSGNPALRVPGIKWRSFCSIWDGSANYSSALAFHPVTVAPCLRDKARSRAALSLGKEEAAARLASMRASR